MKKLYCLLCLVIILIGNNVLACKKPLSKKSLEIDIDAEVDSFYDNLWNESNEIDTPKDKFVTECIGKKYSIEENKHIVALKECKQKKMVKKQNHRLAILLQQIDPTKKN